MFIKIHTEIPQRLVEIQHLLTGVQYIYFTRDNAYIENEITDTIEVARLSKLFYVPQIITKLQAMKQMKAIGKWEAFKTVLANDEDISDEWLLSDNLNRTYPLVLAMGQMFEFTETDLDSFFIEASKL